MRLLIVCEEMHLIEYTVSAVVGNHTVSVDLADGDMTVGSTPICISTMAGEMERLAQATTNERTESQSSRGLAPAWRRSISRPS